MCMPRACGVEPRNRQIVSAELSGTNRVGHGMMSQTRPACLEPRDLPEHEAH